MSVTSKLDMVLVPNPCIFPRDRAVLLAALSAAELHSPRWSQKHWGRRADKPSCQCSHRTHPQFAARSACTQGTWGLGSDLPQWGHSEDAMSPDQETESWRAWRKGHSSALTQSRQLTLGATLTISHPQPEEQCSTGSCSSVNIHPPVKYLDHKSDSFSFADGC